MEGTAQMFANYLVQFKVIAGKLDAKREVWNEFIEPVDPMRFDEGALRIVKRLIIMNLEGKGARLNQLWRAHAVQPRGIQAAHEETICRSIPNVMSKTC